MFQMYPPQLEVLKAKQNQRHITWLFNLKEKTFKDNQGK